MKLEQITIENYRQFNYIKLNLENDLTVIAGANNSGKTALTSLIRNILKSDKDIYNAKDIPGTVRKEWIGKVFPLFQEFYNDASNIESDIENKIVSKIITEDGEDSKELDTVEIKFKVTYTKNDDIKLFSDYIMDLDLEEHSFYFYVTYKINRMSLINSLVDSHDKFKSRFKELTKLNDSIAAETGDKNQEKIDIRDIKIRHLENDIVESYVKALECTSFFCNKDFTNRCKIDDFTGFRKLFNIHFIKANRPLDDEEMDHSHLLNKQMMKMASKDPGWKEMMKDLPDRILNDDQIHEVKTKIRDTSLNTLQSSILELEKTNGGTPSNIMLDFNVTEANMNTFLGSSISTSFAVEDIYLGESSQGLGYSNMIFMHLQLQEFNKNIDPLKVNLFFIEEPESHMHPQMQKVFVKYLINYYQYIGLQGIVTTHSNEMVRIVGMKHLRVLRKQELLRSELYDLSVLQNDATNDPKLNNFYDWFFEIGYSEIVFADKVVFYEGDTERLFIRKIIQNKKFNQLEQQYIAYIQVGGAYAYNYAKLIKFLQIKSLIITDIDYDKDANSKAKIMCSQSTNNTINQFYKDANTVTVNPTVEELYAWAHYKKNIIDEQLIYLAYQTDQDSYGRTLEEAMLGKVFRIKAYSKKTRSKWIELRNTHNLKFSIPNNRRKNVDSNYTLRDILASTSGNKTDFMYSVILNGYTEEMLPKYIEEGLKWLMK